MPNVREKWSPDTGLRLSDSCILSSSHIKNYKYKLPLYYIEANSIELKLMNIGATI